MSRGNTLCFPLIGKHKWSWQLAACRDAGLPASKVADAQISTWAGEGGSEKCLRKASSRGASASAPGPGEHCSVEAQTGTSTLRWWVWMSATADHSQTKLLFSSHLTTDYTCLILSSHFERTIITSRLILAPDILLWAGRTSAVQGMLQTCMVREQSCGGPGWVPHPWRHTVAPGRPAGSSGGAPVLIWNNHTFYTTLSSFQAQPWELKVNHRLWCCWFPNNIQGCALKTVSRCSLPIFSAETLQAQHCATPSTHHEECHSLFKRGGKHLLLFFSSWWQQPKLGHWKIFCISRKTLLQLGLFRRFSCILFPCLLQPGCMLDHAASRKKCPFPEDETEKWFLYHNPISLQQALGPWAFSLFQCFLIPLVIHPNLLFKRHPVPSERVSFCTFLLLSPCHTVTHFQLMLCSSHWVMQACRPPPAIWVCLYCRILPCFGRWYLLL